MRVPFKKSLSDLPIEDAHGGAGKRQMILSPTDPVSAHLHAMTKGFLDSGAAFDWHEHDKIDEYFLVLKGSGVFRYKPDGEISFATGDLIYIPANLSHRIENTGKEQNEFYFIRIDA